MRRSLIAVAALAGCLLASNAGAVQVFTLSGQNQGLDVEAQAVFTTGTDTVTVTLRNLLGNSDITAISQNISDIFFSVSGGATSGLSITSSSGQELTVAADGTGTPGSTVATGWKIEFVDGQYHLTVLGAPAGPTHTIIGGDGGPYDNANASIAGNGPHNPFLFGDVTFVLNIPGVTSDSIISGVIFSFGTTPGEDVPCCGQVAEPGTLLVLGVGLAGVGYFARRRRSQ